jgi:hypothetical protein
MTADDVIMFWHGSTAHAADNARADGALRAQDPFAVAAAVERHFGLASGAVGEHAAYGFSRDRHRDPGVYLDDRPQIAVRYAQIGSETLEDALRAAYQILHPLPDGVGQRDRRRTAWQAAQERFAADYRHKCSIRGVLLQVSLPAWKVAQLDVFCSRPACAPDDPVAWYAWVCETGPFGTLTVPGDIPFSWVTDVLAV